ncbi:hypothetical protein NC653_000743 [Populus alba x Populus x berolinensis]|uniref:Uncharacterized protein n=1 Tax=Populus alba x Populus x berolinensis TaxID=444605 RepID=A0AAD6WEP9_9ROSI|nr:hypothetical protein NC653_000743 [Populus alba x Populus x berolinensis]
MVFVPLLSLFIARILRSFLLLIHDNGLKSTILGFLFTSIKMVPGVKGYIDAEKQKEIPELFIIGRPDVTIVAIRSNDLDIFEVNDIMISNMLASECIAETQQGCSCWLFGGGGEGSSVMASSV